MFDRERKKMVYFWEDQSLPLVPGRSVLVQIASVPAFWISNNTTEAEAAV